MIGIRTTRLGNRGEGERGPDPSTIEYVPAYMDGPASRRSEPNVTGRGMRKLSSVIYLCLQLSPKPAAAIYRTISLSV